MRSHAERGNEGFFLLSNPVMMLQTRKTRALQFVLAALVLFVWQGSTATLSAQTASPAPGQDTSEKPGKVPPLRITLDTSQAPEMAKWAARAKLRCEQNYPLIWAQLGSPGFRPPVAVKIVFANKRGVAWTAGRRSPAAPIGSSTIPTITER